MFEITVHWTSKSNSVTQKLISPARDSVIETKGMPPLSIMQAMSPVSNRTCPKRHHSESDILLFFKTHVAHILRRPPIVMKLPASSNKPEQRLQPHPSHIEATHVCFRSEIIPYAVGKLSNPCFSYRPSSLSPQMYGTFTAGSAGSNGTGNDPSLLRPEGTYITCNLYEYMYSNSEQLNLHGLICRTLIITLSPELELRS